MNMTAKQKLESLTNAWYGFFFVSAVANLLRDFGVIKAVFAALSFAATSFVVWFIGRRLQSKSSLTRMLMLIIAGIGTLSGSYAAAKLSWMFVHEWSLWILISALWSASAVVMYVRSWRTLTDSTVKAYFG